MNRLFFCFFFSFIILSSFAQKSEWGSYSPKIRETSLEKPYKILAVDGGGIRGAYTAQILAMLENELHFLQYVDLFAGTSTGSILACGLAYGLTPDELVTFYQTKAEQIFVVNRSLFEILQLSAKYLTDPLKQVLEEVISPEETLADLNKKVLCVSFDLYNPYYNNWTPALLDNYDQNSAEEVTVVDAILRSTAAPTYYPSYQGYIDGGMVANNPSMMALARAIEGANQTISNIRLLSIGTGITCNYIQGDVDWGVVEWILDPSFNPATPLNPLIDFLFDGTVSVPHFQCARILGPDYFRFNTYLSSDIALDDWKQVNLLIEDAKNLPVTNPEEWEKLVSWVKEQFIPCEE